MKHILVLGGGVIGVTTAWQLSQAGFAVTVIEREPSVALETSFANGGQISVSHATPWANPSTPLKALKWLFQEDAPLLFRWKRLFDGDDVSLWRWGWQFLQECTATQADKNLVQMVNLGLYSRKVLGEVRAETGITYDFLDKGIMHFYTSELEFASSFAPTQRMQELGCDRRQISVTEAVALEPALAQCEKNLVGATYTALDESGDAHVFSQALAKLCQKNGVEFLFNTTILQILAQDNRVTGVKIRTETGEIATLTADSYVLALGSYSPILAKPLGIDLPIYPAKGYSATFDVLDTAKTPEISLIDDEFKLVYSRLGQRLRVAGTAEFNGFNTELNPIRCQAIARRVEQIFPHAVDLSTPNYWTGLRPMTPSNVPMIGRAVNRWGRFENLWLNTGHGTLGWTHSNGSARAICDLILGQKPDVKFNFLGF